VDRRTFIQRGLIGGALLAAGGTGVLATRPTELLPLDTARLRVLTPKTFTVLAAVAARVAPIAADDAPALALRVDDALSYAPARAARDINQVLELLEGALTGLLLRGRATVFTKLEPDEQDAALERWRDGRITLLRGAYQALRKLCLAAHYTSLTAAYEVGYPGPPFAKPDPGPIRSKERLSPPYTPRPRPGGPSDEPAQEELPG
jgi:hypothetical protein